MVLHPRILNGEIETIAAIESGINKIQQNFTQCIAKTYSFFNKTAVNSEVKQLFDYLNEQDQSQID